LQNFAGIGVEAHICESHFLIGKYLAPNVMHGAKVRQGI
jgi:hypothetical protein